MNKNIMCIGGGNMGRAIIGGLIATGYDAGCITVIDPDPDARARAREEFGVSVAASAGSTATADIVLLAVKPQIMAAVARGLRTDDAAAPPLYVSIAAGITTAQLTGWLGAGSAIVRVMPNTPSMVGCGAAALFANDHVDPAGRDAAQAMLEAVGIALWVDDEAKLDAVTALSGSGPAYFFAIFEILEKLGEELGLDRALARQLAIATGEGAARLARQSGESPSVLREQVTSPGGTTQAALEVLGERGLEATFRAALKAAHARSVELANDAEAV